MSEFSKRAVVAVILCVFSLMYERYEVTAVMLVSQLGLMAGVCLFDK